MFFLVVVYNAKCLTDPDPSKYTLAELSQQWDISFDRRKKQLKQLDKKARVTPTVKYLRSFPCLRTTFALSLVNYILLSIIFLLNKKNKIQVRHLCKCVFFRLNKISRIPISNFKKKANYPRAGF